MTETTGLLAGVHAAVLWGCILVMAGVFALMIHSIATFRRAAAGNPHPRNATAEVLWALVPIIIVIATAAPAVHSLMAPAAPSGTALERQSQRGPELAGQIPQKAFHDGGIPL
ncbi:cytochrome c oxidase subunit II transmembrane domain-containing protein [Povalibacter sp.]|uniref:cytochrome c oxidase subunit II transmembrane domain-containing protein n=1 Tax=Povalibacter sp. TaxID=1962978 RepID=UPI002F42F362